MDAPKYQPPPLDPAFLQLQQQTQQQDINAIQATTQRDTASLLARYGANLAMAGTSGSAGISPAALTRQAA